MIGGLVNIWMRPTEVVPSAFPVSLAHPPIILAGFLRVLEREELGSPVKNKLVMMSHACALRMLRQEDQEFMAILDCLVRSCSYPKKWKLLVIIVIIITVELLLDAVAHLSGLSAYFGYLILRVTLLFLWF